MNDENNNEYYYDKTESDNGTSSENGQEYQEKINYETILMEKNKSRAWSVAALTLSIISLVCCCFSVAGIIVGAIAIISAIISRINLGYFDGLSIAALIVGIFGIIFGIAGVVASYFIDFDAIFEDILKDASTDI